MVVLGGDGGGGGNCGNDIGVNGGGK